MNRPSRSHANSPGKTLVPSAMLRSRSNNLLPREAALPHTTVLIPFQDFSKSHDADRRAKSEHPAKIGKSMLMKTTSASLLPAITVEANLPKFHSDSSVLKAKYQFKTPPRSRKRTAALSTSVPDVIALIRNPPKLHDSFLRQKLPKIDFTGKAQEKNASFEKKLIKGAETEPVTTRKEETPERVLTTKLRPVKANRSIQHSEEASLPAVIDVFRIRTRTGVMYGKPKRYNQDSVLALQDFSSTKNQCLFAVFDGHGTLGHEVSAFVKRVLPLYIDSELPRSRKSHAVRTLFHPLTSDDQIRVKAALKQAHLATAEDLSLQQIIDVTFSGTTAVSVLLRGRCVVCSNVGDSRAVVGRLTPEGWAAIPLSNDHKPNEPDEQARIERSGGRVEPYTGDPYLDASGAFVGPYRVWLQGEQVPGLAMSRSIGDLVATQAGVVPDPEIVIHELTPEDKLLILASDGVWEFLTSQTVLSSQCVKLIGPLWETNNIDSACDRLLDEALTQWKRANSRADEEVIDDISFILVFLR